MLKPADQIVSTFQYDKPACACDCNCNEAIVNPTPAGFSVDIETTFNNPISQAASTDEMLPRCITRFQ